MEGPQLGGRRLSEDVQRPRVAAALAASLAVLSAVALPGLLINRAQAASPATADPVTMQLLSESSWGPDSNGDDHVVGELVDNSSVAASDIRVTVDGYDSSGAVVGSAQATPVLSSLDPGQSSPFELSFVPPPGYDHVGVVSITATATTQAANTYFGTRVTDDYTDSAGNRHLAGTVTNESATASSGVQLVLSTYNAQGVIVGIEVGHPQTDGAGDLGAGQTGQFDIAVPSDQPKFSTYRLVGDSASPPQPTPQDAPVSRLAGTDATATAIAVSQQSFDDQAAQAVVLARSDFFTDALAGGPLADAVHGPLLITPGATEASSLDSRVAAEIERVLPQGDTIYILGGIYALSSNIDSQLEGMGYKPARIAGETAAGTAVAIAEQLGNPATVFETTGTNFPDALSAVPAAIKEHGAILLTDGANQDPATAAYLAQHQGDLRYAVGGPLAAAGADPPAVPVWGYDLYDTSAVVAARFFPSATVYGSATGANYPDALAGGVFMADGGRSGPVLLVAPTTPLPPAVQGYLADSPTIGSGYLFGGTLAVTPAVATALAQTPSTTIGTPPPPPLSWSTPTTIDPSRGEPSSISCPSPGFCMAVDSSGNWLSYNGSSWSPPSSLVPGLSSVSCPSTQFCLAVGPDAGATYNGTTWSVTTTAGGQVTAPGGPQPFGLDSVSCLSSTFCVAVGVRDNPNAQIGGDIEEADVFDGATWSAPVTIDTFTESQQTYGSPAASIGLASVSCASSSFCVAVDDIGDAFTYTASGWSQPVADGLGFSYTPQTPVAVSCGSTSSCTAVFGSQAAVYNGNTWGAPVTADPAGSLGLDSVSCIPTGTCVAVDGAGRAVTYNGLGWSSPTQVDPAANPNFNLSFVSCDSLGSCGFIDRTGNAAAYDGLAWSTTAGIDRRQGHLTAISCASTTFCIAVDEFGWASTYSGATWSNPVLVDPDDQQFPNGAITAISCPSPNFCAAADSDGSVITYNGSNWTSPQSVHPTGSGLGAISCISPSFCVATGDGYAYTFNGSSWSQAYLGSGTLDSVSCPSTAFCLAGDDEGNSFVFDGSQWSQTPGAGVGAISSISCASAAFCVAVSSSGGSYATFNGSTWSSPVPTGVAAGTLGVSCPSASFCAAVVTNGDVIDLNSSAAGPPQNIDGPDNDLTAISCPSATYCVAVDGVGRAVFGS